MIARMFAATALSVACSLALAASTDAVAPARAGVNSLDRNGDGLVSRDEASGHPRLAQSFDQIDANKDGLLNADELRAVRRHANHRHQGKLDANDDGSISREEAKAAPRLAEHFDAMDANKDGVLTRDEMLAWRNAHPRPTRDAAAQPVKP